MRQKKQKMRLWKKILIIVLSIILLGAAAAVGVVYWKLSQIGDAQPVETVNPSDEYFETDDPATAPSEVIDPDDISWPEGVEPITDKDVFNILLIGQDRREGQSRQRSDTMIIVSYDLKDGTVKLISLMRDLYVQIPGYSDNRINAAYVFGGMELLNATIQQNFGITIDGNFEVDFEGFVKVIDKLGGVDITLYEAEAEYMQNAGYDVVTGRNHMDGKTALAYVRIRYVGNSDWERTDRQRTLLTEVIDNVNELGLTEKLALLDELLPSLTTDLTNTEILSYAYTVLTNGYSGLESYRIPGEGTYDAVYIRGMAVLLPDLEENRELLHEYIYGG